MEKICDWCNLAFIPKHGNQKYCSNECAKMAEMENARLRMQRFRQNGWYNNKKELGSSLNEKRIEPDLLVVNGTVVFDWRKEIMKVKKEMKWHGIT